MFLKKLKRISLKLTNLYFFTGCYTLRAIFRHNTLFQIDLPEVLFRKLNPHEAPPSQRALKEKQRSGAEKRLFCSALVLGRLVWAEPGQS